MLAERRAALVLLATTFIWGATFFISKLALAAIHERLPGLGLAASAFFFMAVRFVLAAAIIALVMRNAVRRFDRSTIVDSFWVALPGFFGIALQNVALPGGSSSMVAFLTSLMVVTVPLLDWIIFRKKLTRSLWIGGTLSLAGVALMTRPWTGSVGFAELAAFSCSFVFGAQILLVNHFTPRHDAEAMTLGLNVHYLWMSAAALAMSPGAGALKDVSALVNPISVTLAWSIPFLAIFASIIAFWAFMRFQKDMPATRAAIIYCLEPLLAAVMAWMFASEKMGGADIVGGVVILAGNLACELLRRGEPAPSPDPSPVPAAGASPPRTTAPPPRDR